MPQKVLITGIGGFAGRYTAEYIRSLGQDHQIIGLDISDSNASCDIYKKVDLTSIQEVTGIIRQNKPDCIIHLAGVFGRDDAQQVYSSNVLSLTALLEAVRIHAPKAVIVTAGSAAEYGRVPSDQMPIKEDQICSPVNPYGMSKLMATQTALFYQRVYGLNITVVRPFQLIGKGVSNRLAPGAFAEQISNVVSGKAKSVKVGNLESSRDFLDVRDAAKVIWALCQKPSPGKIFNLCSAVPVKLSDLLQEMINASGENTQVEVDSSRFKGSADVDIVYGDNAAVREHCQWKPSISIDETVKDMFA